MNQYTSLIIINIKYENRVNKENTTSWISKVQMKNEIQGEHLDPFILNDN